MYPDITQSEFLVIIIAAVVLCVVFQVREWRQKRRLHDPDRVASDIRNGREPMSPTWSLQDPWWLVIGDGTEYPIPAAAKAHLVSRFKQSKEYESIEDACRKHAESEASDD